MVWYVPCRPSFISTQFFVLKLTSLLFFDITLLNYSINLINYYINLINRIINNFLFFWGYIYCFWYFCFTFDCLWFILGWTSWDCCNFIRNFGTSQVTSCFCCFLNCFSKEGLSTFVADFLAWSRSFSLYLLLKFLLTFLPIFLPIFFMKRQKPTTFYKYLISRLN